MSVACLLSVLEHGQLQLIHPLLLQLLPLSCLQTFVSRARLAVQKAEDLQATPFEEDNISVVPSDSTAAAQGEQHD